MRFRLKKLPSFLCLLCIGAQVWAAPPSLSINPGDFRYTANVTAVLLENCTELTNPNDILMAYVNGQLRGYVQNSTAVGNRYMSFLTIYSNQPSGDTVQFKIYQAATDKTLDVKTIVAFSDDGIYGNPSQPLELHTNNRPSDLNVSTLLVPERPATNAILATVSATDIDKDNTLSYALVAGTGDTDNSLFQVSGDQLQVKGNLNTTLIDSFHVRLRVTDNLGCSTEKEFALIVDKVNDAPFGLSLSDSTFFENATGAMVGQFHTDDLDLADKFSYSFTSGDGDANNTQFAIYDSSLYFKASANFETKKTYTVRIRTTDAGGLFYDKAFTLYVKDSNDPPTSILLSNTKVFENEPADQFVAKLFTVDEDAADKYTYTFANIGTNDNFSFTIEKDTLFASKVFDFETKNSYIVYLTSTDSSGLAVTKPFTIGIKDTLDLPTDIELSDHSFSENIPWKTKIATLSTVDNNLPGPNVYTYSLAAGKGSNDNDRFFVSHDTLYSNVAFDFEGKNKFSIRLKSTLANGMAVEKEIALLLIDIPSTNITLSNNQVYENMAAKQLIGKISTVSLDSNDTYQYSFGNIGTNDNASFTISHDSLFANKVFDYESKNSYVVYLVSTSLSTASITRSFNILIKDSLDKPTDITLSHSLIGENLPVHTLVGTFTTLDANTPPVQYAYTFVSGAGNVDSNSFAISNDSLYTKEVFDAETKTAYSIRVRSTLINGMYVEKAFNMVVPNTNEAPTSLQLSKDTIAENTADSSLVGTFASIDPDKGESFRYSLAAGDGDVDNKAFAIRGIRLVLVKGANYEKKSSYKIRVRTEDAQGLFLDSAFVIHIRDLNEQPTITIQGYEISELADPNTTIGNVEITDEDNNQSYTYRIMNPDVPFAIDASTGQLSLSGTIDYEKKTSYDLLIKVTDSGTPVLSDSTTLTIKILDEIEDDLLPSADLVSPNGDGKNDTWKIRNVYLYKDYSLEIVDQNSQLVYSVDHDYDNDWDAKFKGEVLPNGIYYYVLKSNTDGKLFKGYITVLK